MPKNKHCSVDQVLGAAEEPVVNICQQFAAILGGDIIDQSDDACSVSRPRPELAPAIRRRPFPTGAMFSFSALDPQGVALNRGEVPLLQREVNPFIDAVRAAGILVSAVHTHWLFDRPRIMYVHIQAIGDPLAFAQATAAAFAVLAGRPVDPVAESRNRSKCVRAGRHPALSLSFNRPRRRKAPPGGGGNRRRRRSS